MGESGSIRRIALSAFCVQHELRIEHRRKTKPKPHPVQNNTIQLSKRASTGNTEEMCGHRSATNCTKKKTRATMWYVPVRKRRATVEFLLLNTKNHFKFKCGANPISLDPDGHFSILPGGIFDMRGFPSGCGWFWTPGMSQVEKG